MTGDARARVVAEARAWIGTPYRHQASVRGGGSDCLGLVRGVWREVLGSEPEVPPPYSADWGETGGREFLLEAGERNLRRLAGPDAAGLGSVLLFRMRRGAIAKHLGILSCTSGRFIHAYSGHGVIESALTDPWRSRLAAAFDFPFERD